ncbi:MAG: LytTR family transcriptional regulator DNA-binding domain-containing protein, partial [Clostridiales bacterium]|nr:LytTR family transcriptional regulator DNA-binding domain-containing protein [Clostridiales bacterium]
KMSELHNLLPKTSRFYECGRGLIVNFSHVTQISDSGEVLLSNNQKVYCSRRRIKDTVEAFTSWRSENLRKGTLYR